jgi:hypothetical protein
MLNKQQTASTSAMRPINSSASLKCCFETLILILKTTNFSKNCGQLQVVHGKACHSGGISGA